MLINRYTSKTGKDILIRLNNKTILIPKNGYYESTADNIDLLFPDKIQKKTINIDNYIKIKEINIQKKEIDLKYNLIKINLIPINYKINQQEIKINLEKINYNYNNLKINLKTINNNVEDVELKNFLNFIKEIILENK